jgi:hypothetical protein
MTCIALGCVSGVTALATFSENHPYVPLLPSNLSLTRFRYPALHKYFVRQNTFVGRPIN